MPSFRKPRIGSFGFSSLILWIDAQLSPHLAAWASDQFQIEALSLRQLGLRDSDDYEIFESACAASAVILTKDRDFVDLLAQRGSPPQVVWLRCGNITNAELKTLLLAVLPNTIELLKSGQSLVQIRGTT